ncbi:MAG: Gfo/Idh/MocA family oxidoreductase [Candidatus Omnitrophica bacterium]|nr:Gfo/Idh/MocA family oxidoreductase [Candidatus Omnitrophota bacterium]
MEDLKFGMIGLDTSHCAAFTGLLNDKNNPHYVKGGRIVKAYPGGSDAFSCSKNRVAEITANMKDEFDIELVDTIEAAAENVDGIFLTSVDGRQHLEQFEKIAPFGKPVFIDKPFTTSVEDGKNILELSEKFKAPIYSCSAIRYALGIADMALNQKVSGCEVFGPMAILEDFPGLFWYGIHSAELLFSKLGRGCAEVIVQHTETADVVTGIWQDGRVGTLYGYRIEGLGNFGCTVFTDKGVFQGIAGHEPPYYALMMPKILDFFRTGKSPIDLKETLEITAFLEAANQSRQTAKPVKLKN